MKRRQEGNEKGTHEESVRNGRKVERKKNVREHRRRMCTWKMYEVFDVVCRGPQVVPLLGGRGSHSPAQKMLSLFPVGSDFFVTFLKVQRADLMKSLLCKLAFNLKRCMTSLRGQ
jgi:hypothetical protein